MGVDEDFEQAAKDVKELKSKPSDEDLLTLYGLFKTATVGKVNTSRPGLFDPKGKAKWDAWKKVEDKSPEEAKQEYILKVQQLQAAS
jgi:diazepam-binding inhibitor (GABA receptor modulating acyl-CoA-binding protein)